MAAMLAVFAQFDNDVRAKRTVDGMLATRMRGGWTTRPPRGYVTAKTANGCPSLAHHQQDTARVRLAFEQVASGVFDTGALAKLLRMPRGHLRETLSAPVYAGFHIIQGDRIKGTWPPIVDIETWEAVQHELLTRWTPRPRASQKFPLRGLLVCECGRRLTASSSRGRNGLHHYYHCIGCGARHRQTVLEQTFDGWLLSMRGASIPVLTIARRRARELAADLAKQAQAYRREAEEGRAMAEERLSKLADLLIDGAINRAQYDAKRKEIIAKHETANTIAGRLSVSVTDADSIFGAALALLDDLPRLLANAAPNRREAILTALCGSNVTVTASGEIRTADSSSVYGLAVHVSDGKKRMAPPTGFEPVLPG